MSCSDPAALLKDGECVPDCGAGFYSQDGVCFGKVDRCVFDAVMDVAGFPF